MSDAGKDASPIAEENDSLTVTLQTEPERLSAVGQSLERVLATMNGAGEDAEGEYQEALGALKKHGVEAIIEIARRECRCLHGDYSTRWALIYTATQMEHRAALPLLKNIAQSPIPADRTKDPHASRAARETVLRTTAVDGIAALARGGDEAATQVLLELLSIDSISIRRAAVVGLRESPKGEDLRDRIARCLPKDQRFLLDLKRVTVQSVEQISDPTRHLSEAGKADAKASAPDMQDRKRSDQSGSGEKGNRSDSPDCGDGEG